MARPPPAPEVAYLPLTIVYRDFMCLTLPSGLCFVARPAGMGVLMGVDGVPLDQEQAQGAMAREAIILSKMDIEGSA